MMRFRYIFIKKLIFELLRPEFSLRYDYDVEKQQNRTTNLYRVLVAFLWPLYEGLMRYYRARLKAYMFMACTPSYGQIARVLNYWYSQYTGGKEISINRSQASTLDTYWYWEMTPPNYLYSTPEPPVYLGRGTNYSESPVVLVPIQLANNREVYEQFKADVALLAPFYINYSFQTT